MFDSSVELPQFVLHYMYREFKRLEGVPLRPEYILDINCLHDRERDKFIYTMTCAGNIDIRLYFFSYSSSWPASANVWDWLLRRAAESAEPEYPRSQLLLRSALKATKRALDESERLIVRYKNVLSGN